MEVQLPAEQRREVVYTCCMIHGAESNYDCPRHLPGNSKDGFLGPSQGELANCPYLNFEGHVQALATICPNLE